MKMDNNTRRFSRTLSEAFPDERAGFSEGWAKPRMFRVYWAFCILFICFMLVAFSFR